jgi:hypothetical protein
MGKPVNLIVFCIAQLSCMALIGGFLLIYSDKKGGELMLSIASTGVGGMIALLTNTNQPPETGGKLTKETEVP